MAKHTPGPWNRGYGNHVYQGDKPTPEGQRLIAVCEPTTKTREDWDEVFANATLMASAPDLLSALKGLRSCITETRGKDAADALAEVDRVIAKAEGA